MWARILLSYRPRTFLISGLRSVPAYIAGAGLQTSLLFPLYDYTARLHLDLRSQQMRRECTPLTHLTQKQNKHSLSAVTCHVPCVVWLAILLDVTTRHHDYLAAERYKQQHKRHGRQLADNKIAKNGKFALQVCSSSALRDQEKAHT